MSAFDLCQIFHPSFRWTGVHTEVEFDSDIMCHVTPGWPGPAGSGRKALGTVTHWHPRRQCHVNRIVKGTAIRQS